MFGKEILNHEKVLQFYLKNPEFKKVNSSLWTKRKKVSKDMMASGKTKITILNQKSFESL